MFHCATETRELLGLLQRPPRGASIHLPTDLLVSYPPKTHTSPHSASIVGPLVLKEDELLQYFQQ